MKARGYKTFGEIADELARKRHGELWRAFRNDYLDNLLHDYWAGLFESDAGPGTAFILDWILGGTIEPFPREYTWNRLDHTGDLPHQIRDLPDGSCAAWAALAAMTVEGFSRKAREHVLEILCLRDCDARKWMEHLNEEKPPGRIPARLPLKRGRPRGSGTKSDAPLLKEMNRLLLSGEAKSVSEAARGILEKAEGAGTETSRTKRLARKYRQTYPS